MSPVEPDHTASTAQGREAVIAEDALRHTRRDAASAQVADVGDDSGRELDAGGRVGGEAGGGGDDEDGVCRAGAVAGERRDGSKGDEEALGGAAVPASRADDGGGDGAAATPPNVLLSDGAPLEGRLLGRVESWDVAARKFVDTVITVEQGYRLYRIVIPRKVKGILDQTKTLLSDFGLDLEKLLEDAEEIPADVFPRYSVEEFGSELRCLSDESVYVKRPSLTEWDSGCGISEPMKSEMRTFQVLAKSPHKSIINYKGCVVRNGRVIALCLDKLKCTLVDAVDNKELWLQLDKKRVISALRSAVAHLHELGICHNDIGPANVMLDSKNEVILIDLDSSKPVGDKLVKGGTFQWAEFDDFVSAKRNDTDALAKLEAFFLKGPSA